MNRLLRHLMPVLKPLMNERGAAGTETTIFDALNEDVRKAIPEEYTKDPNFTKYKTVDEFFKGHRNLVETVGKKGVIVPGEKATQEEIEAFYKGIGRPDKPEGYKFNIKPEGLHPAIKITPEATAKLGAMLHKRGIPQSMADGIIQDYVADLSANLTAMDEAQSARLAEGRAALEKEWGGKEKTDANMKAVSLFLERIGGKDAVAELGDLGASPTAVKLLFKISSAISEDGINRIITGGKQVTTEESEQLTQKIQAVLNDKNHAYWNENDAKHADAVKYMTDLYNRREGISS